MEHDFFKKYIDIINEAQADPTTIDSAERKGEKLDGGDGFNQNVPGQYSYDTEGGRKVTGNKIWGTQTVSDANGARTYDASGQKIGYDAPSSQGMSGSVDTRTGDVTTSFNKGDVGVTATQGAGGQTKALSTRNTMGAVDVNADWKAPEYEKGQLASPTITNVTAKTDAEGGKETAQLATGVGFGGASGKNVGNNTIATGNQDLANMAKQAGGGVDLSKAANAPDTQMAADQRASLQSFANKDYKDPAQPAQAAQGQQPVSEEEEPESIRDLLRKILDIVRDHEGPKEDSDKEVDEAKKDDGKEPKTNTSTTKDNPSQYPTKTDIPKRDLPKNSSAVIGKDDDKEEKDEKEVTESENLYQREYQVAEEDSHEHPDSTRHLVKKLLNILKGEKKVDEDLTPTDPKEVGAKMNEPYISPTARAQDKPNPAANAPEPRKIDAKTTAVPDAQFEGKDEERKIEESLRTLLKSIKESK